MTGASNGIGVDLARELARDGHDLVLLARREAPMQTLAAELATYGARASVIPANLGVSGTASRLLGELEHRGLSSFDVLVNNAGFGDYTDFARAEPTRLSEMIRLHVIILMELNPCRFAEHAGAPPRLGAAGRLDDRFCFRDGGAFTTPRKLTCSAWEKHRPMNCEAARYPSRRCAPGRPPPGSPLRRAESASDRARR